MSRDRTPDSGESLASIAVDVERIADTLDDYMEMSLAGIEMTTAMRAGINVGADIEALLGPLTNVLIAIRERRAAR